MISFLIEILFHIIIAFGLWMMITPIFTSYYQKLSKRLDYRRSIKSRVVSKQKTKTTQKRSTSLIISHLEDLLYLSSKNYQPGASVVLFFVGTGFLMIAVFLIVLLTLRELPMHLNFSNSFIIDDGSTKDARPLQAIWRVSLLLTFIAGTFPYLRLRYQFAQKKNKASYDLLEVIKIYAKFGYLNVSGALAHTAKMLAPKNVLQRPLFVLSEVFANYTDEYELNAGMQRFSSTIETTFSNIFVSNLLFAERESNHQLAGALLELTQSMEQQRETIINVKSKNRDAIQLGLFGNVLVIAMSVGTFIQLLTWPIYFKLQFQTTTGLAFLAFIVSSMFISIAISILLAKPRLDYH